ncbi:50S ribosomal protein L9 [Candidatus Liberibacter americanus]|uniref:Large ribosomal subunit protein bL9 n=1 Tax=Candidatus Liberibacter americanus str. Sao Paulo TaxID=1261131 RepID=U6B7A0_9HYPH|nr:50S ribosomal protein L9 [Candidatus Liberibacter americanus]AHA27716.1 Ribosomal protein L9 [Candidatus Liberibacter americanus str. Sao Paulo]EMS36423.1 50S ribosomal protein L9 [Candidatus Liberibacter americanus PW_SP]
MEVILLQNISNLGPMGKIVKVKDGYGRNYLLPLKKALRANKENKSFFEAQRSVLEAKNREIQSKFEELSKVLEGKSLTIIRSAGDSGQLYGSVSTRDIASLLNEEGFKINRDQIRLKSPIKSVGMYNATISLHSDVEAKINLNIARSNEDAKIQEKSVKNQDKISDQST